jgi:hypothetical protein
MPETVGYHDESQFVGQCGHTMAQHDEEAVDGKCNGRPVDWVRQLTDEEKRQSAREEGCWCFRCRPGDGDEPAIDCWVRLLEPNDGAAFPTDEMSLWDAVSWGVMAATVVGRPDVAERLQGVVDLFEREWALDHGNEVT